MNPNLGGGNGGLGELTFDFLREPNRFQRNMFVGRALSGNPLTIDHVVEKFLIGEWHITMRGGSGEIGFSGYFNFMDNNTVSWRSQQAADWHPGKWKREGSAVTWTFSDDAKGWERTFSIPVAADSTLTDRIDGTFTTPPGTGGLFVMSRTAD